MQALRGIARCSQTTLRAQRVPPIWHISHAAKFFSLVGQTVDQTDTSCHNFAAYGTESHVRVHPEALDTGKLHMTTLAHDIASIWKHVNDQCSKKKMELFYPKLELHMGGTLAHGDILHSYISGWAGRGEWQRIGKIVVVHDVLLALAVIEKACKHASKLFA